MTKIQTYATLVLMLMVAGIFSWIMGPGMAVLMLVCLGFIAGLGGTRFKTTCLIVLLFALATAPSYFSPVVETTIGKNIANVSAGIIIHFIGYGMMRLLRKALTCPV